MTRVAKKENEVTESCVSTSHVDLTDPIPSHVIGYTVINQVLNEVVQGILTITQLRIWAMELERECFTELANEIRSRIKDH
jgi:hypothetical protein